MTKETSEPSRHSGPPEPSLPRMATLIYGGMIVVGLMLMHFWQNNFGSAFRLPDDSYDRWRIFAAGTIAAGFLMTSSAALESWSPSFRRLKETFVQLIGPAPVWVPFWLALLSSFGEEILFRGALQPSLGIVPASILFGLAHIGPDGKIGAWSFWACGAGMVLGFVFQETNCLWPAVLAHFLVNAVSLFMLQRQYRTR